MLLMMIIRQLKLLERSGIDPQKASLKLLDPVLYWPQIKTFIKSSCPMMLAFNNSNSKNPWQKKFKYAVY